MNKDFYKLIYVKHIKSKNLLDENKEFLLNFINVI